MKRRISILITSMILFLAACQEVPLTGRKQLKLVPSSIVHEMSFDQYRAYLSQHQLGTNPQQREMVQRVGTRIKSAVEAYLRQENQLDIIDGYQWEFNLVEDASANAFAMPGGKVVVHTGILPVAQNEAGLATVMGHEIAHAIARHGNERMSQALAQQLGGMALQVAVSEKPQETQQLFMTAYGLGTQIGILLPYSRLHESEADRLGLIFMAMAGYNPEAAIDFWQRMQANAQAGAPPEFLSTHPSHDTRIENLRKWMPEAKRYYNTQQISRK